MNRSTVLVLVLLALAATVFGPVVGHEFIFLDDPAYIFDNPAVRQGLTLATVRWAFTAMHVSNWHPLTWLSHMLDVQLFGVAPGGHHLMNVLYHGSAAAALFLVLKAATSAIWPAFWTALVFAVHPLRVESVAWASERKDVLSGLFWMLCLGAYLRWVRRPGPGRYLALCLLFALGLMAKPMLVSLPLILVLLDYWPLGRARRPRDLGRLLLEKAPLLGLSGLSALVTIKAQVAGNALVPLALMPFLERLANAFVSLAVYLAKTVWPAPLSIHYPSVPGGPGLAAAAAAALVLTLLTVTAARLARRRPYLIVGWGWYLVALLPVAGLVQVGGQALADRYTYLPGIGAVAAVVWLLRDLARPSRRLTTALAAAGAIVILVWGLAAASYVRVWRDGISLFGHALRATPGNWMAHLGLASELVRRGRIAESIPEYERFLALQPADAEGHYNLGLSCDVTGDRTRAQLHYRRAVALKPNHPEAHNNLGVILAEAGDLAAAAGHFRAALSAKPDFKDARENLARVEAALAAGR